MSRGGRRGRGAARRRGIEWAATLRRRRPVVREFVIDGHRLNRVTKMVEAVARERAFLAAAHAHGRMVLIRSRQDKMNKELEQCST